MFVMKNLILISTMFKSFYNAHKWWHVLQNIPLFCPNMTNTLALCITFRLIKILAYDCKLLVIFFKPGSPLICTLSSLKDQSWKRTDSFGGREKVGESSAACGGQTKARGERAADSGATEAGGGGESCRAAEEKKRGERESDRKVINVESFARA